MVMHAAGVDESISNDFSKFEDFVYWHTSLDSDN